MKTKRLLSILLSLVLVLGLMPGMSLTAYADTSGSLGGDLIWQLSGNTLTISGSGTMPDYSSLPDRPWNNDCANIQTVIIGDGVTSIGNFAFNGFTNLTSVTIPDSVTSIGQYAFVIAGLTSVSIPENVTSIGGYAFANCNNLESVIFMSGVANANLEIGSYAFYNCKSNATVAYGAGSTKLYYNSTEIKAGDALNTLWPHTGSKNFTWKAAHTHDFTYSASGATISATCSDTNCQLHTTPAALTISAPDNPFYGNVNCGVVTITDDNNIRGDSGVQYYKATKSGSTYLKGDALASAPTEAGIYVAELTLAGVKTAESGSADVTASLGYSIIAEYPLWVGGTQVTSANMSDVFGNGKVSYTPADGSTPAALTLNGFVYDSLTDAAIAYDGTADLNIVLVGTNSISGCTVGIAVSEYTNPPTMTIRGTGSLTITNLASNSTGIETNGPLVIEGGTITAEGENFGINCLNALTISGGNTTVKGLDGVNAGSVTVTGGVLTAVGKGCNGLQVVGQNSFVLIEGGTVDARSLNPGQDMGSGIYCGGNVTVNGGTLIAAAGTDDANAVECVAIYCMGENSKVINGIVGTGWTNAAGTEGKADIAVNTTGQALTYKKVQFPVASAPTTPTTPSSDGSGSSAPAATTVTIPVSGEDEKVNVTVTVNNNTATIRQADVDKVLEAEDVGTVSIDISGLNNNVKEAVIPGAMVDKIVGAVLDESNNADGLEVKLPTGSVSFDADAVAAISEKTNGKDLTLHLDDVKVTELNSAQQSAVNELQVEVVLDAYLTSGGQRISDFNGGSATVKVPYTLKNGQTAAGLVVWYVANDGSRTQVNASYVNGEIVFSVPHFSNYIIAYDAERAKECPKDSTCPIAEFNDAVPYAWYHDGVHYVLQNGIMKGNGDGTFEPNSDLSRAMLAQILWNMEGKPVANYAMTYSDIAAGAWYTESVRWASSVGIVKGDKEGTFRPDDSLTREELATVLYRYAQTKGKGFTGEWMFDIGFSDAPAMSDWASEAMHWMVMNGVINGKDGYLIPGGNASRAEAATMLMRLNAKLAE